MANLIEAAEALCKANATELEIVNDPLDCAAIRSAIDNGFSDPDGYLAEITAGVKPLSGLPPTTGPDPGKPQVFSH